MEEVEGGDGEGWLGGGVTGGGGGGINCRYSKCEMISIRSHISLTVNHFYYDSLQPHMTCRRTPLLSSFFLNDHHKIGRCCCSCSETVVVIVRFYI